MDNNLAPIYSGFPLPPTIQNGLPSILNRLNRLERAKSVEFEAITNIASDICKTPVTLIGLINENGICYKSTYNFGKLVTQKADEICRRVLETQNAVEFVSNDSEIVAMIFCAGIPLKTSEGKLIGVLCIINYNYQSLVERENSILENLAKLTSAFLEQRSIAIREETQLRFLEENTSLEMYLISPISQRILFANQTALKNLGYRLQSLYKYEISKILVAKNPPEFQKRLQNLRTGTENSFTTFAEQINANGSKVLVKLFVSLIHNGFDFSILIVARNLSNTGFESDFVDYLSNYDSITGLANRRLFEQLLEEKIHTSTNPAEELGILLIDLENFRLLNQSFGFKAGDNIIRNFSKNLVQTLDLDEVLIRTAQDALCLLLPKSNREQLKQKSRHIISLVKQQIYTENDKKFKIQINIGAVLVNSEVSPPKDCLLLAQKACDIAKESGQNQFYLADFQDPLFIRKTQEIEDLVNVQDAIEGNELLLLTQKIRRIREDAEDLADHFEFLLGIFDEDSQNILPTAFVPPPERHDSTILLDKWVLKEALRLIDERHRNSQDSRLSRKYMHHINLSARTISNPVFINYCTDLLMQHSDLAQYICFGVTETFTLSNFKATQNFIKEIRRFGCKFALDDFGSKGASLECLKELQFDFVKIDGSFVSDVMENPISQIIVDSICKLANALKVKVIAKKVANKELENALAKYGVHYIQDSKFEN